MPIYTIMLVLASARTGLGLIMAARRLVAVVWHVFFVALSLVAGAFVVFGLAGEIRH
jgi:hypothetical protein